MYSLTEIKNSYDIDKNETISFLSNILENDTYKIIISVIENSKTVYQMHKETSLPLSSIYKRIKKLEDLGIISIEKISINNKGRKLIFYKSKIKNITFKLNEKDVSLLIS
jgi:predicted transcriptional regulator